MQELLEAIQAATAEDATAEQKAVGADACRTILTALEATAGKSMVVSDAPPASPLAGIDLSQALDLLIARLKSAVTAEEATKRTRPPGVRFVLVRPPTDERRRK